MCVKVIGKTENMCIAFSCLIIQKKKKIQNLSCL
jgi:hypothetical protein